MGAKSRLWSLPSFVLYIVPWHQKKRLHLAWVQQMQKFSRSLPPFWNFRTDLDRSPAGLRFDSFSFQSNTFHQFRVTVQYEGASSVGALRGGMCGLCLGMWRFPLDQTVGPLSKAGARQYIFNLTVAAPPPPVVKVVGPSSVSDACSFRDLDRKNGGGMLTCHLFFVFVSWG